MPKFRLNPDEVSVESFETSSLDAHGQGTVRGYQSQDVVCPTATCALNCTEGSTTPSPTWAHTCPVTCHAGGGCESGMPNCPL